MRRVLLKFDIILCVKCCKIHATSIDMKVLGHAGFKSKHQKQTILVTLKALRRIQKQKEDSGFTIFINQLFYGAIIF